MKKLSRSLEPLSPTFEMYKESYYTKARDQKAGTSSQKLSGGHF